MAKTARAEQRERQKMEALERQRKALEYRRMGFTYRQIGEKLGCSHNQAGVYIKRALKEVQECNLSSAADLIALEEERLNFAMQNLIPKVLKGEVLAIREFRMISESRRKLRGLDAPMKFAPTNPDGTEEYGNDALSALEKIAARMAASTTEGGAPGDNEEPESP